MKRVYLKAPFSSSKKKLLLNCSDAQNQPPSLSLRARVCECACVQVCVCACVQAWVCVRASMGMRASMCVAVRPTARRAQQRNFGVATKTDF